MGKRELTQRNQDLRGSIAHFRQALDLDSLSPEALSGLSLALALAGFRELEKARDDDPASALVLSWLSLAWYIGGQMDSALVESARAMRSNPSNLTAVCFRAMILASVGQHAEARLLLAEFPHYNPMGLYVLAVAGDSISVRARLDSISSIPATTSQPQTARAFAMLGLGDTAQALDALERATVSREIWSAFHPVSSRVFDGIRASARFQALLLRVGLTERDDLPSRRRASLAVASLADGAKFNDRSRPVATVQWNRKATALFIARGGSALRMNAYLAVAQYRAILAAQDAAAGRGTARPSLAAAAAGASVVVLKQFFPLDAAAIDSLLDAQRHASPPIDDGNFGGGEVIGRMVGSATLAYAATDNYALTSPGGPPLGAGH